MIAELIPAPNPVPPATPPDTTPKERQAEAQMLLAEVQKLLQEGNPQATLHFLPRLLYLASPTAEVWLLAATAYRLAKKFDHAKLCAIRACWQTNDSLSAWREKFFTTYDNMDFFSAERAIEKIFTLSIPDHEKASCHLDYSVLARRFHHADMAVKQIEDIEKGGYDVSQLKYFPFHKMFAYMYQQDWQKGFPYFEDRFAFNDFPIFAQKNFQQEHPHFITWAKNNQGKKAPLLLVVEEQGYGDIMQFSRYLPLLKKKADRVVLMTHKILVRLLRHSLAEHDIEVVENDNMPDHITAWLPIVSTPLALLDELTDDKGKVQLSVDKPYLKAMDTGLVAQTPLREKSAIKKIGLIWSSGPGAVDHLTRSLKLKDCFSLMAIEGARIFSFQVGKVRKEIYDAGMLGVLTDVAPLITDFHSTAELMQGIDAMVSVDTAGLHLSTGLGIPSVLLCPFESTWRYSIGTKGIQHHHKNGAWCDMPPSAFYPHLDMVLQDRIGDWSGAIKKLHRHLSAWARDDKKHPIGTGKIM